MNKKQLWFMVIFTVVGLACLQVPVIQLVGSKAQFTLFDVFGPVATGFIGTIPGLIAVALMELINFFWHGSQVLDAGTVVRFFPMLAGALYFGRKSRWTLLIPVAAIIAFNLDPVGRSAWVYSLLWLIPIACYFLYDKFLYTRALGATFTAHAVGGAAWVYVFHLTRAIWLGLIPVVLEERLVFAAGIALTYLLLANVLNYLAERKVITLPFSLDSRYLWRKAKAA
ncbi:hypothetical protein KGQ71_03320 [Patescibacteria group bacterium]|nr:hypothetical protein [Patescibacteria group bacterium]